MWIETVRLRMLVAVEATAVKLVESIWMVEAGKKISKDSALCPIFLCDPLCAFYKIHWKIFRHHSAEL